ncbi:hypothetical protein AWJ20_3223 [Sugiyamaella lignohabitans]|uniref:Uncharacterized protein n=1 Tax=Sugiyamaella lignohabitans TaxID=796027 RepID=A0A167FR30_9ASCO|nr:uncharacterized protein AWJ20_3223 [Sugiyamaella lignohabitans]ANB15592.1 hypothetical protein AWJ20_3223 [Sugiyamaella lignohabitans]
MTDTTVFLDWVTILRSQPELESLVISIRLEDFNSNGISPKKSSPQIDALKDARMQRELMALTDHVLIHLVNSPVAIEMAHSVLSVCKSTINPESEAIIYNPRNFHISGFSSSGRLTKDSGIDYGAHLGSINGTMSSVLLKPLAIPPPTATDPISHRRKSPLMFARKTGYQDPANPIDENYGFGHGYEGSESYSTYLEVWGWTILVSSSLIFIVGILSVVGILDWNEGKLLTGSDPAISYADYESLTGLPIPNYYPSIVVLLGVVAWVWCIVSWMGMKFFRHSKGGGRSSGNWKTNGN